MNRNKEHSTLSSHQPKIYSQTSKTGHIFILWEMTGSSCRRKTRQKLFDQNCYPAERVPGQKNVILLYMLWLVTKIVWRWWLVISADEGKKCNFFLQFFLLLYCLEYVWFFFLEKRKTNSRKKLTMLPKHGSFLFCFAAGKSRFETSSKSQQLKPTNQWLDHDISL